MCQCMQIALDEREIIGKKVLGFMNKKCRQSFNAAQFAKFYKISILDNFM